ncbi:uncharacterized protein BYT42DRAFT_548117 [Radiomyces spectabilis]|uniref:uncharacterized protein n=1 Tax=Radiomyces spectabilis TaxID=64574 RepID=UPI00221FE196|nr:uncharacterized protein BYT42DRAFT_548117 [Radiomyces spectabilis]KAI8373132.1 hypothetical protein BYT42DRAFT_548117 [Radiomyces spectabilis]
MENWTLRDNNDSGVGTAVDNVQLFWKLQALESLGLTEDDQSTRPQEFHFNADANDMSDDDFHQEVDKLFRQSLAIQQDCHDIKPSPSHNTINASSTPALNDTFGYNASMDPAADIHRVRSYTDNVPSRKRSRTPIDQQDPSRSKQQRLVHQDINENSAEFDPYELLKAFNESSPMDIGTTATSPDITTDSLLFSSIPPASKVPATTATAIPVTTASSYPSLSSQHAYTNRTKAPVALPIYPGTPIESMSTTPSSYSVPVISSSSQRSSQPSASAKPSRSLTHNNASQSKSVVQRPQLRVHLSKGSSSPSASSPSQMYAVNPLLFEESKEPMKPTLDVNNLRRLTVATLRTLGVQMPIEELPVVTIGEPDATDSEQVLPAAAMQVITAMILGTSGDKDVSQTLGSQISNGDLVALQRMIVEGLRSKNIVIHTIPSIRQSSASKEEEEAPKQQVTSSLADSNANPYNTVDLSFVKYDPPTNVTRLFLRLYRFIINMLLSTPDCWPFIQPVPETAIVYHQEVTHPMDLWTIEQNVWKGKYTHFAKFEHDMQLVWKNAKAFHRNAGTIPKHAENLEALFYKIVMDLKKQIRKPQFSGSSSDFRFDTSLALPEESDFTYPPMRQVFSKQSTVYAICAISPFEPKARKPKGLTHEKQLYLQLNGPFFQAVEKMKESPTGNHSPVPRFYIAKNRTLLRQVRAQGVLAIFYNTKANRSRSKKFQIETDMILAYPASELFDIDQMNVCTDNFAPKGWIHLRPLKVMEHLVFDVNDTIERDYFRRMFATSKFTVMEDKSGQELDDTKRFIKNIVRTILNLPETEDLPGTMTKQLVKREVTTPDKDAKSHHTAAHSEKSKQAKTTAVTLPSPAEPSSSPSAEKMTTTAEAPVVKKESEHLEKTSPETKRAIPQEISHDVWKRLFNVCTSKGCHVQNIHEKYGHLNWSSPNSEGFFKQVYFLEDVVVQTFRQMTMYQRITEVACLMKLKNLPHMAQMREVLFNDSGDVAGLSMERYQTTLKQYTHVHSHHRLSAYQKYEIIYQIMVCMKTIHEAGLAHRDLSEVNIMVNTIDGQLEDGSSKICLYLIDFGKAVFCEAHDVREWFVDVPRAAWEYDGDVVPESKEELDTWCDTLPWVKGKPDHGYRMYRSIQTLPKTRSDNQVLPWLIHPQAEDIYSIGVMMWKVFAETEPWRGILDTDLQGLRYVAEDDYRIQRALEREVHGELSRQLLLKCLKTRPQDRATASEILDWLKQDDIKTGLLNEWKMYSSETRATRKAKSMYGFEEPEEEDRRRKVRKSTPSGGTGRGRGRPRTKNAPPVKQPVIHLPALTGIPLQSPKSNNNSSTPPPPPPPPPVARPPAVATAAHHASNPSNPSSSSSLSAAMSRSILLHSRPPSSYM